MSMVFRDHSNEGFDEEWAKAMKPIWDRLAEERKTQKAVQEDNLVPMHKLFDTERKEAIQKLVKEMINEWFIQNDM